MSTIAIYAVDPLDHDVVTIGYVACCVGVLHIV
jgi:hypothetical protein